MALLPHIVVLHSIKSSIEFLKNNPEHITFLLGGYQLNADLAAIYGAHFIDQAIRWITNNEIQFALGYRLDIAKVPSICVMYEGGQEDQQFIGDFGSYVPVKVTPTTYASNFLAKDVDADGNLVVSAQSYLEKKIWSRLILKKGAISRVIQSLTRDASGDLVLNLDAPIELSDGLSHWDVVSCVDTKVRVVGASLDDVRVKVFMDVAGDPELGEILSCLMRYILKQSRMHLINNGLNNCTFSHSSIMRNDNYEGTNVWSTEYTITGKLTDQWILLDVDNIDRVILTLSADQSEDTPEDNVKVWEGLV